MTAFGAFSMTGLGRGDPLAGHELAMVASSHEFRSGQLHVSAGEG